LHTRTMHNSAQLHTYMRAWIAADRNRRGRQ
jgi:hypothetical protein